MCVIVYDRGGVVSVAEGVDGRGSGLRYRMAGAQQNQGTAFASCPTLSLGPFDPSPTHDKFPA